MASSLVPGIASMGVPGRVKAWLLPSCIDNRRTGVPSGAEKDRVNARARSLAKGVNEALGSRSECESARATVGVAARETGAKCEETRGVEGAVVATRDPGRGTIGWGFAHRRGLVGADAAVGSYAVDLSSDAWSEVSCSRNDEACGSNGLGGLKAVFAWDGASPIPKVKLGAGAILMPSRLLLSGKSEFQGQNSGPSAGQLAQLAPDSAKLHT